jgi:hypothetical protein
VIDVARAVADLMAHVLIWAGFLGAAILATLAVFRPASVPA